MPNPVKCSNCSTRSTASKLPDSPRLPRKPMIDTLLLLALPASGKSELRRYISSLASEVARRDLGLGPIVQLDDYPYVHLMRRASEELTSMNLPGAFFADSNRPFIDPRDWGTLIHLLNEDYAALGSGWPRPPSAASWLFDRLDRAREKVGVKPAFREIEEEVRRSLEGLLEKEAGSLWAEVSSSVGSWDKGATVIIEFARGGPVDAGFPLPQPHGYAYSLDELSEDIRRRASILYVWVTPEESRRRNVERARPGRNGDASVLFHGVPEEVMDQDYGVDDLTWLVSQADGDAIVVAGQTLPVAIFDNRVDKTSFLRADPEDWSDEDVAALHHELRECFGRLRR